MGADDGAHEHLAMVSEPTSPTCTRSDYAPDERQLRRVLDGWIKLARPPNVVGVDIPLRHCQRVLARWPVGHGAGELLAVPDLDGTPVTERGVSQAWFEAAWWRMKQDARSECPSVPTLAFVEGLCRPLTSIHRCALFFLVPRQFRVKPDTLLSHSWDTWLRHVFFFPHTKLGGSGKASLWLDVLALDLWSAETPEPNQRRAVASAVSHTLLVVPGDPARWSLSVLFQGWCFHDVLFSRELDLLGGLHDADDAAYHRSMVEGLETLAVGSLELPDAERAAFELAVQTELDAAEVVKAKLKQAFARKYPGPFGVGGSGTAVTPLQSAAERGTGGEEGEEAEF